MNNQIIMKWNSFITELFAKGNVDPDCQQMIYLDLLLYDEDTLKRLDETGEIKFGLVRFIKNYGFSKNSRYYYQYNKYYEWNEELKPEPDED